MKSCSRYREGNGEDSYTCRGGNWRERRAADMEEEEGELHMWRKRIREGKGRVVSVEN